MHKNFETAELDNAAISELCAREAEHVSGHLQQAFRRAARKALLWSEEARDLVFAGRSLSELDGIGPSLARRIHKWMDESLDIVDRPPIRQEFLTLTQARRTLSRHPKWQAMVRSDLQMHTVWSDGSATAADMAHVAIERGYSYIAITDHTKRLRITNGLDERQLIQQRHEINTANQKFADSGACFIIFEIRRGEPLTLWRARHITRRAQRA